MNLSNLEKEFVQTLERKFEDVNSTPDLGKKENEQIEQYTSQILKEKFQHTDFDNFNSIFELVSLLNLFYSTMMGAERCFHTASLIHKNRGEIVLALETADISIVNKFMNWAKSDKNLPIKPYSFLQNFVLCILT
ncbi:MAG: hypothetical protein ACRCY4_10680 [Brevinema sp.]